MNIQSLMKKKRASIILATVYAEMMWEEDKHKLLPLGLTKKEVIESSYRRAITETWISEEQAEKQLNELGYFLKSQA